MNPFKLIAALAALATTISASTHYTEVPTNPISSLASTDNPISYTDPLPSTLHSTDITSAFTITGTTVVKATPTEPTQVMSTSSHVAHNGSMSIASSSVLFGSSSTMQASASASVTSIVGPNSTTISPVPSSVSSMSSSSVRNSTITITKTQSHGSMTASLTASASGSATTSAGPQNAGGKVAGGWVAAGVVFVVGLFV